MALTVRLLHACSNCRLCPTLDLLPVTAQEGETPGLNAGKSNKRTPIGVPKGVPHVGACDRARR